MGAPRQRRVYIRYRQHNRDWTEHTALAPTPRGVSGTIRTALRYVQVLHPTPVEFKICVLPLALAADTKKAEVKLEEPAAAEQDATADDPFPAALPAAFGTKMAKSTSTRRW